MKKFFIIAFLLLTLTIVIFTGLNSEPGKLIAKLFNIENPTPKKNDTQPVTVFGKFTYNFQPDAYKSGVPNIHYKISVHKILQENEQNSSDLQYTQLPWNLIESPLYDENGNFGVNKDLKKFKNKNIKLQGVVYNPCDSGKKLRSINSTPADCLIGIPTTDISLD